MDNEIKEIKAERDRWYEKAIKRVVEINRLRAALERIDAMDVHQPITAQESEMRRIAKETLATDMRKCGRLCGEQAPYGFVPESGCPVHDTPRT